MNNECEMNRTLQNRILIYVMVFSLVYITGCGSAKEYNTKDGFMPGSDLSSAELKQLREQVVHHTDLDEMPQVEGGMQGVMIELSYPEEARKEGAGGRIVIDFIVDLDGNAKDLIVVKSAGYGMDEEAIRLVESAKFIPAKQNGESVVARQTIPISFMLPSEEEMENFPL
ncbi:MAG: energy transducer TonB [Balneolaceae bacterium]